MITGQPIIVRHHFRILDPASWLSWLIRTLDCAWANHCAIILQIGDLTLVFEAESKGIKRLTWDEWLKHRPHKSYKIGTAKVRTPFKINEAILGAEGRDYDIEGLLIWHPLRLLTGKWRGGTASTGDMVCSEYVGYCWQPYFPEWYKLTTGGIEKSGIFDFK